MANLKEIRIRIGSVSSTMQITSAMKMVSAAKLKKAQDAITAMRPYSNKLSELMQGFSSASDSSSKSFTENRQLNKVLVVAISSNRGLCGAFNANIAKEISILKSKDKFSGCTVHYVNKKLDSGRVIMQKKVRIVNGENSRSLAKKVLKQEHKLYPAAIMKIFN